MNRGSSQPDLHLSRRDPNDLYSGLPRDFGYWPVCAFKAPCSNRRIKLRKLKITPGGLMIYLANALQLPYEDKPDPNRPFWDTLMALRNLTATPVKARIRLRRDDGSVVMWPTASGPEVDHC